MSPRRIENGYTPQDITYYYDGDAFSGPNAAQEYITNQSDSFVAQHVFGAANDQDGFLIKEALRHLWLNSFNLPNVTTSSLTWTVPPGGSMIQSQLSAALDNIYVHVGPHSYGHPATTLPPNAAGQMHIYIDPTQLGSYKSAFGDWKGVNYAIMHEIGHAMPQARPYDLADHTTRERFANEMGQALSDITGAIYPNDTELLSVGGTVPR